MQTEAQKRVSTLRGRRVIAGTNPGDGMSRRAILRGEVGDSELPGTPGPERPTTLQAPNTRGRPRVGGVGGRGSKDRQVCNCL